MSLEQGPQHFSPSAEGSDSMDSVPESAASVTPAAAAAAVSELTKDPELAKKFYVVDNQGITHTASSAEEAAQIKQDLLNA